MKIYNLEMHKHNLLNTPATHRWGPGINVFVMEMLAVLGALAVAISVILMSIWLATLDIKPLLGAGTWAVAFIFFALAFDKRGSTALLHAITGAALVVLAWLQNAMTTDYVIVSGVLLATWIAVATFKQFKTR